MDEGSQIISWFNEFWPGVQSEAGDARGRADFTELVNCYVADREIRMWPGSKVVFDGSDPEPGNDGYLDFVRDARRPVAHATTFPAELRERLTDDYNPVSATFYSQWVYAHPVHYHSFHVMRGRPVILGETSQRIEPIFDVATNSVVSKVAGWSLQSSIGALNLQLNDEPGSTTTVIRVGKYTAFEWMVGLGIRVTSAGPLLNEESVITDVTTAAGSTYDEVTISPALTGAPSGTDTFELDPSIAGSTADLAVISFTPEPGDMTATASLNRQHNRVYEGDVLWIADNLVDTNTADAALLAGLGHLVVDMRYFAFQTFVTLATHVTAASNSATIGADCGRCRGAHGGPYSFIDTVNKKGVGIAQYRGELDDSFWDSDSLTAWWIEDALSVDSVVTKVYPSYVANRQRDFADTSPEKSVLVRPYRINEGHIPEEWGSRIGFGRTRRPSKALPYRVVPQVAGNRLLIAAPGYGCMFQVPSLIPSTSDRSALASVGAIELYNEANIRPRSLGVPKGVLCETTSDRGWPVVFGRNDTDGFALGAYRIAVAYRDDATGEIGQLSEVWEVNASSPLAAGNGTADDMATAPTTHSTTQVCISTLPDFPTSTGYSLGDMVGMSIRWLTGANAGEVREILTASNSASGWLITWSVALGSIPVDGDTFEFVSEKSANLNVLVMHPGYALAETMALSVMIYMSRVNEGVLNHVATVSLQEENSSVYIGGESQSSEYGLDPTAPSTGAVNHLYLYPIRTDATFNGDYELPEQRTMPRGATWVGVVRGVPLSGGSIGNVGDRDELLEATASSIYNDSRSIDSDVVTIYRQDEDNIDVASWPIVANNTLPSSYGGVFLWSLNLWPHPLQLARLDRQLNCKTQAPTKAGHSSTGALPGAETEEWERRAQRWRIAEDPHFWDEQRTIENQNCWLVLPRGQIQIHEPGLPSVSLAAGKREIDARKDEESVAGGSFRGTALIFTTAHTYAMQWDHGPAGAIPILVSSEFGCIAPNAVVEYDAGTVWLSSRGIVDYNGIPNWGGRRIQEWFRGDAARFRRDSAGMMRNAFGFFDESREIVLFGLFEDRAAKSNAAAPLTINWKGVDREFTEAGVNDFARSRFPADTVLAYNPRLRAISEWRPESGLEPLWVEELPFSDGVSRLCYLGVDGRLRVLDENFGDENLEPPIRVLTGVGSETAVITGWSGGAFGTDLASRQTEDQFARAGMGVAIYEQSTGFLKARTTLSSVDSPSQLTVADAVSWGRAGEQPDRLLVGTKSMTIKTAAIRPGSTTSATVSAVTLTIRLRSRITGAQDQKPALDNQPLWAKAWILYPDHQSSRHSEDVDDRTRRSRMHKNELGDFVGYSDARDIVRTIRLNGGRAEGRSFQVEVELFGGAHAALQDMQIEIGAQ